MRALALAPRVGFQPRSSELKSDQSHPGICPPESVAVAGSTRWKSLKTSVLNRSLSDSKTQHRVPHCNEVSSATAD